jgi:hypothetical protein
MISAMNNRLCKVIRPFFARRLQGRRREFLAGEQVWYDTDQTRDPVEFTVDNHPWIANRAEFLASTDCPRAEPKSSN